VLRVLRSRYETRRFYDKICHVYDLLAERSEEPVRLAGLVLLNPQPGERVLEVGSGTGHSLARIAEAVGPAGRAYGIDLSPGMLDVARQRMQDAEVLDRVALLVGDGTALPFADGSIDAAFMSFTLELFDTDEIPLVLGECLRVLRPGGRIVVVAVSKEEEDGIGVRVYEWTHEHFPNLLDCRPIYARRALESAGFQVIEVERRAMWVPVEVVLGAKPTDAPATPV